MTTTPTAAAALPELADVAQLRSWLAGQESPPEWAGGLTAADERLHAARVARREAPSRAGKRAVVEALAAVDAAGTQALAAYTAHRQQAQDAAHRAASEGLWEEMRGVRRAPQPADGSRPPADIPTPFGRGPDRPVKRGRSSWH